MDKLLAQFLEIAEAGSLSAAAARLRVSQPGLSSNMRRLERDLGVSLFVRSSRGMKLSEYGEILINHVRVMHRLDTNARTSIASLKLRREGGMRIGCGHAWWTLFLRDMVLQHDKSFPNAPVSVDVGSQFSCMDHLLSGDTAAFIGHKIAGLSENVGAEFEPLFSVRDALFVRSGHPLIGVDCDSADIARYGVVDSVPIENKYRRLVESPIAPEVSPLEFQPSRHVFEANSLLACLDFVLRSDSIMTYPAVMSDYFSTFGLTRLAPAAATERKPVGIYFLSERREDREVKTTIENIVDWAGRWLANLPETDDVEAAPRSA